MCDSQQWQEANQGQKDQQLLYLHLQEREKREGDNCCHSSKYCSRFDTREHLGEEL